MTKTTAQGLEDKDIKRIPDTQSGDCDENGDEKKVAETSGRETPCTFGMMLEDIDRSGVRHVQPRVHTADGINCFALNASFGQHLPRSYQNPHRHHTVRRPQFYQRDWLPKMRPHFFNGTRHLIPTLLCHTPHWLVLLLGTNDLQEQIQNMYELRRKQEYELGQAAGETMQMSHGGARSAYRNPRNTAGKNKKHYINISPEKKAEEIALSVVAMAYEAKRHFPKLRVVIMTPPLRLTEDNAEWGFNEMSVTIASYFPYAFGKICRLHDIPNVCYPPNSIDMSLSEDGVHITEEHNQIRRCTWRIRCLTSAIGQASKEGRWNILSRSRHEPCSRWQWLLEWAFPEEQHATVYLIAGEFCSKKCNTEFLCFTFLINIYTSYIYICSKLYFDDIIIFIHRRKHIILCFRQECVFGEKMKTFFFKSE